MGERSKGYGFISTTEIEILHKLPLLYGTVKKYHMLTEDTFIVLSTVYQRFSFLRTILAGHIPHCVCRSQYNKIYFGKLFPAAHFSRKSKKPSDKVPMVHLLLCNTILQPSKISLYSSIYVIMYDKK